MIEIFSTARAVRDFYASRLDTDAILPKAMTIADFESKAWFVPGFIEADKDSRVLLMQEAINFDDFSKLYIPTQFMAFLQNSNYIFRFFEELASERVDINALKNADTYEEFNEHILILEELQKRYCKLLDEKKLYDKITLPLRAKLNTSYLSSLKSIRIHLEGYLSNFEYDLLLQAGQYCDIYVVTPITSYNKKIKEWLGSYGIKAEVGEVVECHLNEKKLIKSQNLEDSNPKITFQPFSTRALQAAFVFEQIEVMIGEGIEPENIAVVLPDESFAQSLRELDNLGNLNFAMGKSVRFSSYYQRLDAILKHFQQRDIQSKKRLDRFEIDEKEVETLSQSFEKDQILEWIESFLDDKSTKEVREIVQDELFLFEKFLEKLSVKLRNDEILTLFLTSLGQRSMDDVRGGKITVVGVLEIRGARYDGLIIVDFNDDMVPKRSNKDMFLSNKIRSLSKLPSSEDRENLQRFFYDRVIKRAKRVSLSCVSSEEKLPSRFLKTFDVQPREIDDSAYFNILFKEQEKRDIFRYEDLIVEHDFFYAPLSSSRLKCFLECPEQYYFRYIKKYKEVDIPSDDFAPKDMGDLLHNSLKELHERGFNSLSDMREMTREIMHKRRPKGVIWELNCDIWLQKLENFFIHEMKLKDEGWKIYALEKTRHGEVDGCKLYGKIDRIDVRDGKYRVYDYKSGKIEDNKKVENALNSTDFQLQFYSILCEELGEVEMPQFYKLDEGRLISDNFFEDKKAKLIEHLHFLKETKEFNFRSEDDKKCKYFKDTILSRGGL